MFRDGAFSADLVGSRGRLRSAEGSGRPRRWRRGRWRQCPASEDAGRSAEAAAGGQPPPQEKLQLRDYSPVGEKRASEQKPFAAIITCADSRISPELVFDVERGNIFVSRIAGNSIDQGTLGSAEYAVGVLGVKVVMVLGTATAARSRPRSAW